MSAKELAVKEHFLSVLLENDAKSPALACIETLLECVKKTKATTLTELNNELKLAISVIQNTDFSYMSVSSAGELFLRFISLAVLDNPDQNFSECQKVLWHRGQQFLRKISASAEKIALLSQSFMRGETKILIHGQNSIILMSLIMAAKKNQRCEVYLTDSEPKKDLELFVKQLRAEGINCTVILFAAVGYIMEKMDMVFVGAEGVVENGGIVNKIGTLTVAICAKAKNKPLYVLTESIKFYRVYPLNQSDMPVQFKYFASVLKDETKDISREHPLNDYTPPEYISLLFTDLGILTPAAVSDELIKLYL
ncbi:unnamed protein product [Soboliphyme baturini]|uniref:Translation initiation factor eIF2B subunit alpha n=1 Tax=Soboliphyme baturini TaxID=241478 RepID=A0A183IYA6_9BILA|nr:unnamed protein product [Soboliphyme baturini]